MRLSVVCPSPIGCMSMWWKGTPNGYRFSLPSVNPVYATGKFLKWPSFKIWWSDLEKKYKVHNYMLTCTYILNFMKIQLFLNCQKIYIKSTNSKLKKTKNIIEILFLYIEHVEFQKASFNGSQDIILPSDCPKIDTRWSYKYGILNFVQRWSLSHTRSWSKYDAYRRSQDGTWTIHVGNTKMWNFIQ